MKHGYMPVFASKPPQDLTAVVLAAQPVRAVLVKAGRRTP